MTLMLIPSAAFTAFILLSYSIDWKTITTAILAFDIFAGLLSNLQEKTHQAWKKQPRPYLIAFVVVHSTLYPSLLVLLQVSLPLTMLMLAMLFTKTLGFVTEHDFADTINLLLSIGEQTFTAINSNVPVSPFPYNVSTHMDVDSRIKVLTRSTQV
jgi:hypothetical protein